MKKSGILITAIIIALLIGGLIFLKLNSNNDVNQGGAEIAKATNTPVPTLKNTCDIVLEPKSTTVKAGQDLAIEVKMTNLKDKVGIGALLAKLVYDKGVFEQVTKDNLKAGEEWDAPEYNSQNEKEGTFFTLTQTGENITTDNLILTINLKVKEDAKAGNTTIKLTDISTSDSIHDIYNDDAAVSITIEE